MHRRCPWPEAARLSQQRTVCNLPGESAGPTICSRMDPRGAASLGRESWDTWPTYDSAVLGFRDYWYPVAWSSTIGRKALPLTLLGDKLMLVRDAQGQARALRDRCPHRGVPLSLGRQEVP